MRVVIFIFIFRFATASSDQNNASSACEMLESNCVFQDDVSTLHSNNNNYNFGILCRYKARSCTKKV